MKGWRERAADIFTKHGEIAAKMKSAPGPGTTDLGYSTTPHPTKGVRPRARFFLVISSSTPASRSRPTKVRNENTAMTLRWSFFLDGERMAHIIHRRAAPCKGKMVKFFQNHAFRDKLTFQKPCIS